MKLAHLLLGLSFGFVLASPSLSGPNANGVIIAHVNESLEYTDALTYCDESGLQNCESADTRVDTNDIVIISLTAAFPPGSSPRLTALTFVIEYDETALLIIDWDNCGDFELPTGGWPAPGEGNVVVWGTAQTGHLTDFYWFAAYTPGGAPAQFTMFRDGPYDGMFDDDAIPPNLDEIVDFGSLGFHTDGYLPCPDPVVPGACCFDDCTCLEMSEEECYANGGAEWIPYTVCDPDPCGCPAGACCFADGTCLYLIEADCEAAGGTSWTMFEVCDPNPCEQPTPTIDTTWGQVKNVYR